MMSDRPHYHTVFISDVHLGSVLCQLPLLWSALRSISFDRIIIGGDLFDTPSLNGLSNAHLEFLLWLRNLGVDIILIPGNHDRDKEAYPRTKEEWHQNTTFVRIISDLLGAQLLVEYEWHWNGKKCIAYHGDRDDRSLSSRRVAVWAGTMVHSVCARFDSKDWRITRWLKTWLRDSAERLERRAVRRARLRGASIVCAGHIHLRAWKVHPRVTYFNAGCWVDCDPAIVAFGERDAVLLEYGGE